MRARARHTCVVLALSQPFVFFVAVFVMGSSPVSWHFHLSVAVSICSNATSRHFSMVADRLAYCFWRPRPKLLFYSCFSRPRVAYSITDTEDLLHNRGPAISFNPHRNIKSTQPENPKARKTKKEKDTKSSKRQHRRSEKHYRANQVKKETQSTGKAIGIRNRAESE